MKKTVLAIASTIILAPTFAMASDHNSNKHESAIAYTGPIETVSVATLLADTSMFAEQEAIVDGKIIRQLKNDTFIFSDGQSEIQIELDDDIHLAQPLTADTKVRIFESTKVAKHQRSKLTISKFCKLQISNILL